MTAFRLTLWIAAFLFSFSPLTAQHICGLQGYDHAPCCEGLIALEEDQFTFVPPPANFDPNGERSVVISVNYTGFTTEAMIAFDYAVDIWASNLLSNVPIVVNATMTNLGSGVLGSAGPATIFRNFSGAPEANTWYPVALANKLAGFDLSGGVDISCQFNTDFNWYYGTDGNTPGGQYDFVSVVLHELGHGLGFVGSASVSGSNGSIGQSGDPYIYDLFVETVDGTDVVDMPNNSVTLGNALTGNQLYWNGPEGMAANSGNRPRLYAPGTWNPGSSFSHLNESTYPSGNSNSLMTPFLGSAEAIHTPGDITYGIFIDMGWEVGECAITDIVATTQTPCDPLTNTYSQTIEVYYELPPSGLLNINGSNYGVITNPAVIVLNDLPADGQPVTVDAFFNALPECSFTASDLLDAPLACCINTRITEVNTTTKAIRIHNYGQCTTDLSEFELCALLNCEPLGSMSVLLGSLLLDPGEEVVVIWNSWTPAPSGTDLCLFSLGGNYTDPDYMMDFVQWGSPGNGYESVAVTKGIWGSLDYVTGFSPYVYTGDGIETGVEFWESSAPPCSIDAALPLSQTQCDGTTNTYSQTLAIQFSNGPATGDLVVNGQNFAVGLSPMLITLVDLPADGGTVDVTVSFMDSPECTAFYPSFFTAPDPCDVVECTGDFNGDLAVDGQDLLLFLAYIGCTGTCEGDLNGDNSVDSADLLLFLPGYGQPCN